MKTNEIYEIKLYEAKTLTSTKNPIHTEQTGSPKVINEKPKTIIKTLLTLSVNMQRPRARFKQQLIFGDLIKIASSETKRWKDTAVSPSGKQR